MLLPTLASFQTKKAVAMTIRNKKPNLFNVPPKVIVPEPGTPIERLKDFSVNVGLLELNSAILGNFVH
jgi:hypothetical protein